MLLRFIGQDGDYGLKNGLVYPCKVYSKDKYIYVRAKSYAFKFSKRHVYIPYVTIERMYNDWRVCGELYK